MKKLFFAVAFAASSLAYCGTGVTQKMMERYVGDATGEVVRVVGDEINTLKTNMVGRIEDLETNVVSYSEYSVGMSNLVDFIIYDTDVQEPTFNTNGSITIVHIDTSTGYPRRIPIVLRIDSETAYATNAGFRVTSSSVAAIDEGQLFACTSPTQFYNSAFGYINYERVTETNDTGDVLHYFRLYGTRGALVLDSSSAYETKEIQVFAYNGTADMSHLVGSFTVIPYRLSDTEFDDVATGQGKSTTDWTELATERPTGVYYWWTQISPAPTTARFERLEAVPVRRSFSIFDLIFPSALAAPPGHGGGGGGSAPVPTVYFTQMSGLPMAKKYDWEQLYPNHEKDEFWEPRMWYKRGDWESPYNWILFPVTVNIPYEYDGESYTLVKTISTLSELQKYFIVVVPPSAYQEPQLKKKKDYCKAGQHIYFNCVCKKCGYEREHTYSSVSEYANKCAICENHNTSVRQDVHGDWVPDTDSGSRCTHVCDEVLPMYHAGWHHEGSGAEPPNAYACSCQCGIFGADANLLGHSYAGNSSVSTWYDAGDGARHYGVVRCTRGNCRHENTVFEEHDIYVETDPETGEPTNFYPYDEHYHAAQGVCKKCHANVEGMLSQHSIVGVEAGETWTDWAGNEHTAEAPFCYCTVCWAGTSTSLGGYEGMHDFAEEKCNEKVWVIYCLRCGYIHGRYEHDFITVDKPLSEGEEGEHLCYCELEEHRHVIDPVSKICNGGKHWATQSIDSEIYGQWVEVGKDIDNGCNYYDGDDSGGGSGTVDIPCWTGKLPDDNPQGKTHKPCGKPNPYPQPPTNIINPCPLHTKNEDVGPYVDVWLDEYSIVWEKIQSGSFFVTGIYPFRMQWGVRKFNGNSKYKRKTERISRIVGFWPF